MTQDHLDRLIIDLYGAALAPETWPGVLREVGEAMGGLGAQILLWENQTHTPVFSQVGGPFGPEAEQAYVGYYNWLDPHHAFITRQPIGQLFNVSDHFDENYVRRSEFYQDFLIPVGSRYVSGLRIHQSDGYYSSIGIQRSSLQGPFAQEDMRTLERLTPHLRQTMLLFQKIGLALAGTATLRSALDRMSDAVLVVSSDGGVLVLNAAADRLLSAGDGLSASRGRIAAHQPADEEHLLRLIRAACATAMARAAEGGGAVAVRRQSGARSLLVLVSPCSPEQDLGMPDVPAALVIICDPERKNGLPERLLISLFGLTRAEASLALSLAQGATVQEAADERQVATSTVRSQLKSIFSKTDTSRQAELVRLLASLSR